MGHESLPVVSQGWFPRKNMPLASMIAHEQEQSSLIAARQLYGDIDPGLGPFYLNNYRGERGRRDDKAGGPSVEGISSLDWAKKCLLTSPTHPCREVPNRGPRRGRKQRRKNLEDNKDYAPLSTPYSKEEMDQGSRDPGQKAVGENPVAVQVVDRNDREAKTDLCRKAHKLERATIQFHLDSSHGGVLPRYILDDRLKPFPLSYSDAQAVFQENDSDSQTFDDNLTSSSVATEDDLSIGVPTQRGVCRICGLIVKSKPSKLYGCQCNVSQTISDSWSLSPRERRRQKRYVMLAERTGCSRALEAFAAQIGDKPLRPASPPRQGGHEVTFELLDQEPQQIRKPSSAALMDESTGKSKLRPSLRFKRPNTSSPNTRLATALLEPIPLLLTPPRVAAKKRPRPNRKVCDTRRSTVQKWRTGVVPLDVTDPEIQSLVDYLMGLTEDNSTDNNLDQAALKHPNRVGKLDSRDVQLEDIDKRGDLLRPLPSVVSALRSAARQLPKSSSSTRSHTRGAGLEAIPSSASRVLQVLMGIERLWCQGGNSNEAGGSWNFKQTHRDFSDREVEEVVWFFDTAGTRRIQVAEVLAAFRIVQEERIGRRQPSSRVVRRLVSIGLYLEEHGMTPGELVEQAASSFAFGVMSPTDTEGDVIGENGASASEGSMLKRPGGTTATREQMGCMILRVIPGLSEEQCDDILEQIEEGGLVSGAQLTGALERANTALSQGSHGRPRQVPATATEGVGGVESENSRERNGNPRTPRGSPRRRRGMEAKVSSPAYIREPKRGPQAVRFNHIDAALLSNMFARDAGGVECVSTCSAVGSWCAMKRRLLGTKACRAGRAAARCLCRFLRERSMKPLEWFDSLDCQSPEVGHEGKHVSTSSVIWGVKNLFSAMGPESTGDTSRASVDMADSANREGDEREGRPQGHASSRSDTKLIESWNSVKLAALATHLDPCGRGTIAASGFQDGLHDCFSGRISSWDSSTLMAGRQFEGMLRVVGHKDVCNILCEIVRGHRGGDNLHKFLRQLAESADMTHHEPKSNLSAEGEESTGDAIAPDQQRVPSGKPRKPSLRERLAQAENAGVVGNIRRMNDLMAAEGRRLGLQFYQIDRQGSGEVDHAALKQAIEHLVMPHHALRVECKRRRDRLAAIADAERQAKTKEKITAIMERLVRSKGGHFLEAVSRELHRRKLQIRDVFRNVDMDRTGALTVDDLLRNTRQALGLRLDRDEAAALVTFFDRNGDSSIQCEELEDALRSYRRYKWERARYTWLPAFDYEFPSLANLFHREREKWLQDTSTHGPPMVCRQDVVIALMRLRGDPAVCVSRLELPVWGCGKKDCGKRDGSTDVEGGSELCSPQRYHCRQERLLTRGLGKIARYCVEAGLRSKRALVIALGVFEFGPADRARRSVGCMRAVDLRQWLWLLRRPQPASVPEGDELADLGRDMAMLRQLAPKEGVRVQESSEKEKVKRLLTPEEMSLVLNAVGYRPLLGEEAVVRKGLYVSVHSLWELLKRPIVAMVREIKEKARREAEEIVRRAQDMERREREERERRFGAARVIQCAARQHLARTALMRAQVLRKMAIRNAASLSIQCAFRQYEARRRVQEERSLREAERRQVASIVIGGAFRQMAARKRLAEARALRESGVRKISALYIQCAFRQHLAKKAVGNAQGARNAAARQASALTIQCAFKQFKARRKSGFLRGRQLAATRNDLALIIQCAFRKLKAKKVAERKRTLVEASERKSAAAPIQCAFRQHQARKRLAHMRVADRRKSAVVTIQCAFRQRMARKRLAHRRWLRGHRSQTASTLAIQCAFRQYKARVRLAGTRNMRERWEASITIQLAVRQRKARRSSHRRRDRSILRCDAAVTLDILPFVAVEVVADNSAPAGFRTNKRRIDSQQLSVPVL